MLKTASSLFIFCKQLALDSFRSKLGSVERHAFCHYNFDRAPLNNCQEAWRWSASKFSLNETARSWCPSQWGCRSQGCRWPRYLESGERTGVAWRVAWVSVRGSTGSHKPAAKLPRWSRTAHVWTNTNKTGKTSNPIVAKFLSIPGPITLPAWSSIERFALLVWLMLAVL